MGGAGFGIFTESNMKSGGVGWPLLGLVLEVHTGSSKGSSKSARFWMGSRGESVFESSGLSIWIGQGVGIASVLDSCFFPKRLFFFGSIAL